MRYLSEHGKTYGTVEDFNVRKALYAETDAFINSVNEDPTSTYTSGHNRFSDWTKEEKDRLLGLKNVVMPKLNQEIVNYMGECYDCPKSWDWRKKGMVTPVKD